MQGHSKCDWPLFRQSDLHYMLRSAAGRAAASACGGVLAALHERLRRCAVHCLNCFAPQPASAVLDTAPVLGLRQAAQSHTIRS